METMKSHYGVKPDAMSGAPFGMAVASSPATSLDILDPKVDFSLQRHAVGAERVHSCSDLWGSVEFLSRVGSNFDVQSSWDEKNAISSHYENGLFSSSLSELHSQKLTSPSNDAYGHSVNTDASHFEAEPFESLEEMEAQTIGNLLPDDDDLLSGVVDGHEHVSQPSREDELEDLDLFSSVGGMDLGDDASCVGKKKSDYLGNSNGQLGVTSVSITGEHPYGERPSRTLFVRNIDRTVEDSELQAFFKQYGDICTLYTTCKHSGFIMISYYDIRAACGARKALQNKLLRHRRLDVHYSITKENPSEKYANQGTLLINVDSTVSNDDLLQIFGAYGEIKEIHEAPHRSNQKVIEFYDVRAANEALRALNQSDIAGKKIKLEPSLRVCASSMQMPSPELADESGLLVQESNGGFSHGPINSSIVQSDAALGVDAGIRAAMHPLLQNSSRYGISSSVPCGLSSVVRAESLCNQSGISGSGNLLRQVKYDFGGVATLHPHSLPEYTRGLANAASYTNLPSNFSSLLSERVDNSHLSCTNPSIDWGNGIGSAGNACGPFGGYHYVWSNSKHPHSFAFMLPDSPSLANGLCTPQSQPQLHGLAGSPSHIFNSAMPINGHHVGSAPAVNPSLWDRQNSYLGGSPEASALCHGSFGNMRLSGSHLHQMDFVSHNMFPRVGGRRMDLSISSRNVGLHSYRQRCAMHPTRGQLSVGGLFDPSNGQTRGRRSESSSTSGDRKQYELDIDRIQRGEDNRTTLMIKNIPNKYTSKMLMAAIDECHHGTYDFIYLPIDFKNKCNVGYAFINLVDPSHIISLYESFNGKRWEKFNSEKVASLAYARIQGKAALIAHFQNSSLMNEDKRCRPILLHSDGPNAGDQVPFPMGISIRFRSGRSKSCSKEDNHQENTPSLASNEESPSRDCLERN